MVHKYIVNLSVEEREELESLLKKKICSKEKRLRAYVLLKSDRRIDWSDKKIKEAYGVSVSCVERLRKRLVEKGFEFALHRKQRECPPCPRKIQGIEEARLIALCCSAPPSGRNRWTLKLLADKMVELQIVNDIGAECVRRTLKKMNLSLG